MDLVFLCVISPQFQLPFHGSSRIQRVHLAVTLIMPLASGISGIVVTFGDHHIGRQLLP